MVPRTEPSPHGSARIAPEVDVVAGSYATWTITYEVGELGLDDGGTVLVAFSQTTDMGEPQFDDPAAPNYCRAETDGNARLEAQFDPSAHVRPMKPAVRLTVRDGSLAPGETIELELGAREDGSPGMHVQSFPETGFAFRVIVDPHNSERYVRLGEIAVDIVPGVATDLAAVLPSTAAVGEAVDLRVRAEDYWGNVATGFDGDVRIEAPEAVDAPDAVELGDGTGTATVTPRTTGVHRVRVVADDPAARAVSNPLVCRDGVDERTFWGDPHGQTGETVGTGTVDSYFRHLRDAAFLDFGAHAGNDFQITDDLWADIKAAGRAVHEPGEFVAFHCYEWSANTALGGDHNVYFRGDDPDIARSSEWLVAADDADRHEGTHPISALYERFEGRDDVLIIPHQGGRPATLEALDPELTPFLEIVSCWGVFEWFAEEALAAGHRIGVVGGSDDHTGRPGTAPPDNLPKHNVEGGLMAARADELTRESLWDAFTDRRVSATSGDRILLSVQVGDAAMGEAVARDGPPEIDATVHGTAPIRAVDCFRGGERVATRDRTSGSDAIELRWSGARSKFRDKALDWSGSATLDHGRIAAAETFGFDHPEEGITRRRPDAVFWDARTTGNHQGARLRVDAPGDATLHVATEQASATVGVGDLDPATPRRVPADGIDAELVVERTGEATDRDVSVSFQPDETPGGTQPYWIRVRQVDGEMAWSSPVFVTGE